MKKYLLYSSLILNIILITYVLIDQAKTKNQELTHKTELSHSSSSQKINIVMLGNSITAAGDWNKELNRLDVFNGGQPGWTTQQLSWVIKDYIIPKQPVLCFFKGGINDYTLGINTKRIYQNICINLDSIKKVGTHPVYQTTLYQRGNFQTNRQIDTLNSMMKRYCEMKGYDFLDLRPFLCKDGDIQKKYVKDDHTHLKPEAYPVWAKAMQPILKKYGL